MSAAPELNPRDFVIWLHGYSTANPAALDAAARAQLDTVLVGMVKAKLLADEPAKVAKSLPYPQGAQDMQGPIARAQAAFGVGVLDQRKPPLRMVDHGA